MNGYLDRERASRLMAELNMDALVLTQPESILYATGSNAGVAATARRAAAALLLVPADLSKPVSAVIGDAQVAEFSKATGIEDVRGHPLWFDSAVMPSHASRDKSAAGTLVALDGSSALIKRPAQYWPEVALKQLGDMLEEQGLSSSQIGLELEFVPVADMPLFETTLPQVKWLDASRIVCKLRSIKKPKEIDLLRRAAYLCDQGLYHLRENVREGHVSEDFKQIWRDGVYGAAAMDGREAVDRTWSFASVGDVAFGDGVALKKGDVVRLDLGVVIQGYSSDIGRTWAYGQLSAAQQSVYDALREAYDTCLPLIRPGTSFIEIHRTATDVMHKRGFSNYYRGHFGHGVGASVFSEEWPFIGPDEDGTLEENMVIAFETPYYIDGLGNFIIEDQMLITKDGHETMYTFDKDITFIK